VLPRLLVKETKKHVFGALDTIYNIPQTHSKIPALESFLNALLLVSYKKLKVFKDFKDKYVCPT